MRDNKKIVTLKTIYNGKVINPYPPNLAQETKNKKGNLLTLTV